MPTYGSVQGILDIFDRIQGRKYLNDPARGQAALGEFQTYGQLDPDLVAKAAKYPEVAAALDAMAKGMMVGPTRTGQEATTDATRAGAEAVRGQNMREQNTFDQLGMMTPEGMNAKANVAQANALTQQVGQRPGEAVSGLFGQLLQSVNPMDQNAMRGLVQAGSSTIPGPAGELLKLLFSSMGPSAADQDLAKAVQERLGQQKGAPAAPAAPLRPPSPGFPGGPPGPPMSAAPNYQPKDVLTIIREWLDSFQKRNLENQKKQGPYVPPAIAPGGPR